MNPEAAQTSILRVSLLLAQAQFENSSETHNLHAHNHATNILNCIAKPDKPINRAELQSLAFRGVPDEVKGLRPIVWRILLNYLPQDAKQWEDTLR